MELIRYVIKKIEYNVNAKAPQSGSAGYTPKINVLINNKENSVDISVKIDDEGMPFNIEVSVIGFYEFKKKEKIKEELLKNNGVAILLPYVRAIISQITAMAGLGTLVLPLMNVKEMNEQAEALNKNK